MIVKILGRIITTAFIGLTALSTAQATPLIFTNITMEVKSSSYQVTGGDNATSLLAAFNSGSSLCSLNLADFTGVGGPQNCALSKRNLATLYTVDYFFDGTGSALFELGADWGRGGIVIGADGGDIVRTDDIWWARSWNNADVIDFTISGSGYGTFQLLGFEGCCSGYNSLRYSVDSGQFFSAVRAVVEPAPLALLGLSLGAFGVMANRKRPKKA